VSSAQRIKSGKERTAAEQRDTLTLKELIEAKIPDKLPPIQTAVTPLSVAERREEAVARAKKAKAKKQKKKNQIAPAEDANAMSQAVTMMSSALTLPRSALDSPEPDATAGAGAGAMQTYKGGLDSPSAASARAKLKAAKNTLRGAELLVRTPKMPAGLPVKGGARPPVLTSTQKDLVKAINKSQKGPKRRRKVAKGGGMAATLQEGLSTGDGGVRKLRPAKVKKGGGSA
jgi:hypothetical protein